MSRSLAALVTFLVTTAVGCGGGGTMTFEAVRSCLEDGSAPDGLELSTDKDDLDLLAEQAGLCAVRLSNDVQEIHVLVERSSEDAENAKRGYDAFNVTAEQHGNVLVAANKSLSEDERRFIEPCVE